MSLVHVKIYFKRNLKLSFRVLPVESGYRRLQTIVYRNLLPIRYRTLEIAKEKKE